VPVRKLVEKALAELRKPAAKRVIGHDRDHLGFLLLVNVFTEEEAETYSVELIKAQLPGKIDCLTCRFLDRQWAGEPCHGCLDDYTAGHPYPRWRRAA
jgi:hypothetical protein